MSCRIGVRWSITSRFQLSFHSTTSNWNENHQTRSSLCRTIRWNRRVLSFVPVCFSFCFALFVFFVSTSYSSSFLLSSFSICLFSDSLVIIIELQNGPRQPLFLSPAKVVGENSLVPRAPSQDSPTRERGTGAQIPSASPRRLPASLLLVTDGETDGETALPPASWDTAPPELAKSSHGNININNNTAR